MESKINTISIRARTKKEVEKMKDAISLIQKRHSRAFELLKNLTIVVLPKKGYENMLFPEELLYVLKSGTVLKMATEELASLLVHEARHLWQYTKGRKCDGEKAEEDAYKYQRKFLLQLGKIDAVRWLDKQFKEKWWMSDYKDIQIFAKKYKKYRY